MRRKLVSAPGSSEPVAAKPRKTPDFSGVPGKIVAGDVVAGIEGRGLVWGTGHRKSPYDAILDELKRHTLEALAKGAPLPALEFGDGRARAAVCQRAKKKGLRALCAEFDGKLFVRLDKLEGDPAVARRRAILEVLRKCGPQPVQRIAGQLRTDGDTGVDAAQVSVILAQMAKAGEVVQQEGGAWALAPAQMRRVG